jgi:hypothetical protein
MIQELVKLLIASGVAPQTAALSVLRMDPFDLALYMEQVWRSSLPWGPLPAAPPPVPTARATLFSTGAYSGFAPMPGTPWEHLGYSYVLENTRAVQIMRRVVREYRSGEGLGIPSIETQQWLDTTEALIFGAANPLSPWMSTSWIRQDAEAVRRNAYWRFFGMDLAFGSDDNRAPTYDKAQAFNGNFVPLFEELLFELWQAISNVRNTSGANAADDDRIYRIAQALNFELQSRRQSQMLSREELAAATALGWIELTLSGDSPVVTDLRAVATSAADRLKLIGERVGLAPHSRSASLFSMAADLSIFLRVIESGVISSPTVSWVLYLEQTPVPPPGTPPPPPGTPLPPPPIGASSRRVITEWAAATGKDLKGRSKPVEVRRQLATAR